MNSSPSILMKCAGAALLAWAGSCHASCPAQISQPSVAITDVADGWRPYIAAPLYLHSVAISDGPPERLGQLKGRQVRSDSNAWTDTYDLHGPYPEGKWLQCSYGMLNEIVLSRRLDDSITACTIEGKKGGKAGQNVFSVACR
ncbi:STY0301 family protein [Massilia sp. SR12]